METRLICFRIQFCGCVMILIYFACNVAFVTGKSSNTSC